ncbi:hypothetical protein DFH28DRAFT_900603 [Melampsora americana]|nr:hypothetical protein DFH28DRAFT_900603 [Melampsora americana]
METGCTLVNRKTSGHLQQNSSSRFAWCDFRPATLLENTSSTARDHLANERTYLAWMRTSLGFTTVGIAITQLFHTPQTSTPGSDAIPISPPVPNDTEGLTTDQIVQQLVIQVQQQARALENYTKVQTRTTNSQVGIGIGVTFMCLGIMFLVVGTKCEARSGSKPLNHLYFYHALNLVQHSTHRRSISSN